MGDHARKVLITDGHYKQSLALARLFYGIGFEVHTLGERLSPNRFSRYWRYFSFRQLKMVEEKDPDPLFNLLSAFDYDLLVPVGANSVDRVSKRFEEFSSRTHIFIPDQKKIALAFDKLASAETALQLGLRAPKTVTAQDWLTSQHVSSKSFIVKNKRELGQRIQTQYFSNSEEVSRYIHGFNSIQQQNMIVQERIQGSGEAFFAFYDQGVLLDSYTHKRVREIPSSGGSSTCASTTNAEDVHQAGKKILDYLHWQGPAMVEFKRSLETGELYLMEINPKFWGSLDLGIAAGFNPAKLYLRLLQGIEESVCIRKSINEIKFQWPWHGDISQIRNLRVFLNVVSDLFNPTVRKNMDLLDPAPIIAAPVLATVRLILASRFIQHLRMFFARARISSIKVATQRSLEEILGIPFTNKNGRRAQVILGPQISWIGKFKLKCHRIDSSISLQSEFNDFLNGLSFPNHLHLPCEEYSTLSDTQLIEGVTTIRKWVSDDLKVYIHCREGVSRAAYLGIAYEVSNGKSIEEATNIFRLQRPFINPLPNQVNSIQMNMERLRKLGVKSE
jgi:predicted ATP-grasp superfamily ATP-dependent carboligase